MILKKRKTNPETILQSAILATINRYQLTHFERNNNGSGYLSRTRGAPAFNYVAYGLGVGTGDLIGSVEGRYVSIEVKTPKGRASDAQKANARFKRNLGIYAVFVNSVAMAQEYVEAILNELNGTDPSACNKTQAERYTQTVLNGKASRTDNPRAKRPSTRSGSRKRSVQ